MIRAALVLALGLGSAGCAGPTVVEEVLAVDRFRLSDGRVLGLAGIEAPAAAAMAAAARAAGRDLAAGKTVEVVAADEEPEAGEDGRGFFYLPVREGERTRFLFVNRELVLFGYARAAGKEGGRHAALRKSIREAENVARREGLGMWRAGEGGAAEP